MKNNILKIGLSLLICLQLQAQYSPVVQTSNQISDNLDLRAVASMFGDAQNLEHFESLLNDPRFQISNLDLNRDNRVDYLRVVESVDRNTHLVIIQAIIDFDTYQDVATIDIDRDYNNNLQVQFIGNNYIYGTNCIYEPAYPRTPLIYASLFSINYRPYVSNWRWNYYPKTYRTWQPCPVYKYRKNIEVSINLSNTYHYVNYRRSNQAVVLYKSRCSNGYERLHPEYHFSKINKSYSNRYELDKNRNTNYNNYNQNSNTNSNNDPNRYGASRPRYLQRIETNRNNNTNDLSKNRESRPNVTENKRDYTNETFDNRPKETSRNYSTRNSSNTRERNNKNEAISERSYNIKNERQNQSQSNSRRRT